MHPRHHVAPGQIGNRARHAQRAGEAARGELQFLRRAFEQGAGFLVHLDGTQRHLGIGQPALPRPLTVPRLLHAGGDDGGGFAQARSRQGGGGDGLDFDDDVDAVQQRAADFALVILATARRTAAFA